MGAGGAGRVLCGRELEAGRERGVAAARRAFACEQRRAAVVRVFEFTCCVASEAEAHPGQHASQTPALGRPRSKQRRAAAAAAATAAPPATAMVAAAAAPAACGTPPACRPRVLRRMRCLALMAAAVHRRTQAPSGTGRGGALWFGLLLACADPWSWQGKGPRALVARGRVGVGRMAAAASARCGCERRVAPARTGAATGRPATTRKPYVRCKLHVSPAAGLARAVSSSQPPKRSDTGGMARKCPQGNH